MTIFDLLKKAIETKTPVSLVYGGKKRLLCPHMLGRTAKGVILHAYQYGGETGSGIVDKPENGEWRFLYLEKLEGEAMLLGETVWYPEVDLTKSEDSYKKPAGVLELFALAPRTKRAE